MDGTAVVAHVLLNYTIFLFLFFLRLSSMSLTSAQKECAAPANRKRNVFQAVTSLTASVVNRKV